MRVMKGRDELWTDETERRAAHLPRFIRMVERSRLWRALPSISVVLRGAFVIMAELKVKATLQPCLRWGESGSADSVLSQWDWCHRNDIPVLLTLVSAQSPSAGMLVFVTVTPDGKGCFILRNPKLFLVLSPAWVTSVAFSLALCQL